MSVRVSWRIERGDDVGVGGVATGPFDVSCAHTILHQPASLASGSKGGRKGERETDALPMPCCLSETRRGGEGGSVYATSVEDWEKQTKAFERDG